MNGIRKVGRSFETDPGGRINEPIESDEIPPIEEVEKLPKPRPVQDKYDKSGATENPYPNYTDRGEMESSVKDGEDKESETNSKNEE